LLAIANGAIAAVTGAVPSAKHRFRWDSGHYSSARIHARRARRL